MKAFRIKDWESKYEDSNTKKIKNLSFVLIPNKMDGLGYRLTATRSDGAELFAAWVLLLEVASHGKPSQRGWLIRDGVALTPRLLSVMTGFKERIFRKAMEFFTSAPARWLEEKDIPEEMMDDSESNLEDDSDSSGSSPAAPESYPSSSERHPDELECDPDQPGPKNRTEGNRTEQKEGGGEPSSQESAPDLEAIQAKSNPCPGSSGSDPELPGEDPENPSSRGLPSKEEIFQFGELQGYPRENVQDFIDYWESESWTTRNGNTLSNGKWKPRLSKWIRESFNSHNPSRNGEKTNGHISPLMERRAAEYDEPINIPIFSES